MYRHWDHFTGDKRSHLFLVSVETGAMRDLNPGDTHDVPPFSLEGSGCGCDICAGLEGTGVHRESDPDAGDLDQRGHLHAGPDRSAAKPVKVCTSPAAIQSRLLAGREVSGMAQPGAGGI